MVGYTDALVITRDSLSPSRHESLVWWWRRPVCVYGYGGLWRGSTNRDSSVQQWNISRHQESATCRTTASSHYSTSIWENSTILYSILLELTHLEAPWFLICSFSTTYFLQMQGHINVSGLCCHITASRKSFPVPSPRWPGWGLILLKSWQITATSVLLSWRMWPRQAVSGEPAHW